MRYVCIILSIHELAFIELHIPRNTREIFTYNSDKYWSRVLFGWNDILNIPDMSKDDILCSVQKGGYINYFEYWFYIFQNNKTLSKKTDFADQLKVENKYYLMCKLNVDLKSYNFVNDLVTMDELITDILYYVRHIILNKKHCKFMLGYIVKKEYISNYLIDQVYDYLSSEYIDSSKDMEKRNDVINLLQDIINIYKL